MQLAPRRRPYVQLYDSAYLTLQLQREKTIFAQEA